MEICIRRNHFLLEDQADLQEGCKKCRSLEVPIEPINDQETDLENFPADEIGVPKISLDAPNDEVVAPMENLSGGVRFDRISNRCT